VADEVVLDLIYEARDIDNTSVHRQDRCLVRGKTKALTIGKGGAKEAVGTMQSVLSSVHAWTGW